MRTFLIALSIGSLAVSSLAFGQAKKGILQPQMTVAKDAGTYEAPMGKIGDKGEVWTATSTAAGVDGKPLAGKTETVVGEIVDMSCYLQLGKHGEKHVACGKKCITAGEPIGLVAKNGDVYMLMAEEHDPRGMARPPLSAKRRPIILDISWKSPERYRRLVATRRSMFRVTLQSKFAFKIWTGVAIMAAPFVIWAAASSEFTPPPTAAGFKVPLGLLPVQWPKNNPYSAAKWELGRALYYDTGFRRTVRYRARVATIRRWPSPIICLSQAGFADKRAGGAPRR